jgi:8-oxo-dGTP pyrophosphatase MutT (NUDIX family)
MTLPEKTATGQFERRQSMLAFRGFAQQQSGVLAFRHSPGGRLEVLLIKKQTSNIWGIPKGKLEPGLTLARNACKEAFEEAGVSGEIIGGTIGSYLDFKQSRDRVTLIAVSVFLLAVEAVAEDWPERAIRQVRWCSPQEASTLLRQPFLARLCRELALMRALECAPALVRFPRLPPPVAHTGCAA